VNDPAVAARFRELGVDSITTDRPAFLREQLNKLPQPVSSGNAP
jgi:glycerophosphoryl diester phosphodiesterase